MVLTKLPGNIFIIDLGDGLKLNFQLIGMFFHSFIISQAYFFKSIYSIRLFFNFFFPMNLPN